MVNPRHKCAPPTRAPQSVPFQDLEGYVWACSQCDARFRFMMREYAIGGGKRARWQKIPEVQS